MSGNTDLMLRWTNLCRRLDIGLDLAMFERIVAAYSESHRRYHTLDHLRWCFARLDECASQMRPVDALYAEIALWCHDVVYKVGAKENEGQSAKVAVTWMRDWEITFASEVERAILATALTGRVELLPPLSEWTVDIDLSILGADQADYDAYASAIAEEWVPVVGSEPYRVGRRAFLERMLEAPVLFRTTACVGRFLQPAHANMLRELLTLEP